jgi:amidophosphoribosyltransferase
MKRVVAALNPKLDGFDASCFDGVYVAGGGSADELAAMAAARKGGGDDDESSGDRTTLTLQSAAEAA